MKMFCVFLEIVTVLKNLRLDKKFNEWLHHKESWEGDSGDSTV